MDRKLSKRLYKLIPEKGGFDLSFTLAASGQVGKVATVLNLTIFGPSSEGKPSTIIKKVSFPAISDSVEKANKAALEDTLKLLGV